MSRSTLHRGLRSVAQIYFATAREDRAAPSRLRQGPGEVTSHRSAFRLRGEA